MKLTKRDIQEMIEEEGLVVVSIRQNRHWRVRIRREDGTEFFTSFPVTPSDYRGLLNKRAELRQRKRESA